MEKRLLKTLASLGLFIFLGMVFFMPLSISDHHGQSAAMKNCPFMPGETSLCLMSAVEHLSAWKAMNAVPAVKIVVLALIALACLWRWHSPPYRKRLFESIYFPTVEVFLLFLLGKVISPRAP